MEPHQNQRLLKMKLRKFTEQWLIEALGHECQKQDDKHPEKAGDDKFSNYFLDHCQSFPSRVTL